MEFGNQEQRQKNPNFIQIIKTFQGNEQLHVCRNDNVLKITGTR